MEIVSGLVIVAAAWGVVYGLFRIGAEVESFLLVMVLLPFAMLFAGLVSLMVLIALPIPTFFKGVIALLALGWWMLRDDGGRFGGRY